MPILTEADSDNLRKFKKELDWFHRNYPDLRVEYKGKFVAIKDNQVLDYDKNLKSLTERLGRHVNHMVIEYVNEKKKIYIL